MNRKSSFINIFQEETGYFSYMRVWGSILNLLAISFLVYGVYFSSDGKSMRAIETAWVILGITMVSKVAQKFGEAKINND
jgi:hypothetical protein